MTSLIDKPDAARQGARSLATELRLWLLLTGGSIAVHLVTMAILLPIASRAAVHKKSLEVSPIDFVELPGTKDSGSVEGSSVKGSSIKGAIAPTVSAQPSAAPPASAAPSQGEARDAEEIGRVSPLESSVAPIAAPVAEPIATPTTEPTIAPTEAPTAEPTSPVVKSTEEPSAAPSPQASSPQAPSPQASSPQASSPQAPEQSVPQAAAAPPQVTTERIIAAVPDTSEQYTAETQPIPLTLIASLQKVAVPPEQLETPPPDTIAQPTVISYTFVPDSKDTVCVQESEAIQFASRITLGAKVGVQVATNEAGEVIDTALWQPSQNPLNDQLATCLVKNWNWKFQPAIAQGKPIASKALVIWVRIDRS